MIKLLGKIQKIIKKFQGESISAILLRGATASFSIQVVGTLAAFTLQFFLTRFMGIKHYGEYIYVFTWINVLSLFSKMGMDTLLLRYIPAYKEEKKWSSFRGILQVTNYFSLRASFILAILAVSFLGIFKNILNIAYFDTFLIGFLILPILSLTSLRQAALQALRYIALSQLPEAILRPFLLTLLIGLAFWWSGDSLDARIVMLLNLGVIAGCFLLGAYFLNKVLPPEIKTSFPKYRTKEWIATSLPLFLISTMQLVLSKTDIIMIGFILGTKEVGIYAITFYMANLVRFCITAVNSIVAPMISQLYLNKDYIKLQHMLTLAARCIFITSLPIAIPLIFFGKELLSLFGSEFSRGSITLAILAISQLVNALSGSVGFLMVMTGNQGQTAWVTSISAILNVILNLLLIPFMGIIGAAISNAVTMILWNLILIVLVWKKLKLKTTIF